MVHGGVAVGNGIDHVAILSQATIQHGSQGSVIFSDEHPHRTPATLRMVWLRPVHRAGIGHGKIATFELDPRVSTMDCNLNLDADDSMTN